MERSERILIVDDEQMFRDTTAELLGYRGRDEVVHRDNLVLLD